MLKITMNFPPAISIIAHCLIFMTSSKIMSALMLAGLLACIQPMMATALAQPFAAPPLPVIPQGIYDIANFGAVGDGVATNTAAIQAAIDAASKAGGGTVQVPAGIFLSGPLEIHSQINLHLVEGSTLKMLPLDKYPGGTIN